MDTFLVEHFGNWLTDSVYALDHEWVAGSIFYLLDHDPELLNRHSWPELFALARRS